MNIFFDCEFTGLKKDTELISIGLISEDGKKFYAEFNDYKDIDDKWIWDNVITKLMFKRNEAIPKVPLQAAKEYFMKSNTNKISYKLNAWLNQWDNTQFVSDVCHYDFVLLIDLLTLGGTALQLNPKISPACHDINQDIARAKEVTLAGAFSFSRKDLAEVTLLEDHNALHDAVMIKCIWEEIGCY